jgi:hypothetical protein
LVHEFFTIQLSSLLKSDSDTATNARAEAVGETLMSDVNNQRTAQKPKSVVGPDGKALTVDDLPPPNTQRWVARRKAEVVAAVRAGLLSLEDACRRYSLSTEEFLGWESAIDKHGLGGLRVTRIQDFR